MTHVAMFGELYASLPIVVHGSGCKCQAWLLLLLAEHAYASLSGETGWTIISWRSVRALGTDGPALLMDSC